MATYFSCESFFNTPSGAKPPCKPIFANTYFFGPLNKALGLTAKSYQSISRCVAVLLLSGYPSAIIRLIHSVVINSVNCVFRANSLAHIFCKGGEAFGPPIANSYTPATVPMISRVARVKASIFHALPRYVPKRFVPSMRRNNLLMKASAAFGCSSSERVPRNGNCSSAGAITQPIGFCIFILGATGNGESSKSLSCKIYKSRHDNICAHNEDG